MGTQNDNHHTQKIKQYHNKNLLNIKKKYKKGKDKDKTKKIKKISPNMLDGVCSISYL